MAEQPGREAVSDARPERAAAAQRAGPRHTPPRRPRLRRRFRPYLKDAVGVRAQSSPDPAICRSCGCSGGGS